MQAPAITETIEKPARLRLSADAAYRLGVASRSVAAIVGGYVLAALVTILLSVSLPMARSEAVMTATLLSFAIYTCAVMWVFATRSALRAWLGLAIPATVIAAILQWMDALSWSFA
ncbi:DUF3649 domain-containing protein [Janthinobacterium lividum]|uniref:DUF3649 domain-containing protein n=1 Tax=Janthinobacterium lividum TaxID=29581 RepID=UPI0008931E2A|nr:DUF3649 domain-containing protein [Janthinobacterium lividum]MCC7713949.1 DUF3649 domain-containing protein [Janthinobacterium lividum]OEZ54003.1 hypothetical protein JANLI_39830 [Janthinobacterium lividum]WQE28110.1 DUF3649 domain-containing protein [Janthinobacterium lividum]STQ99044.1 Protein of uncharacterised function (DUF3649) [Janthinobacterium lividum]